MSQDLNSLLKELKFVEESFKSGLLTKSEYETAKARVEAKLAQAKREEDGKEEIAREEIKGKEELTKQEIKEEPKIEIIAEPKEIQPKDKIRFEIYGKRYKFPAKSFAFIIGILLVIFIVIFSINRFNLPTNSNQTEGFMPICKFDLDCQKEGFAGKCENPSTKDARCIFLSDIPINITVITSKSCAFCDINRMQNTLTQLYPGASYILLNADEKEAKRLIKELDIAIFPAYVFDSTVEKTIRFNYSKSTLIKKDEFYVMKPEASGSEYFFQNPQRMKSIELFFNPFTASSFEALKNLLELSDKHDLDYSITFYTKSLEGNEAIELLREACIRKIYNEKLGSYLDCLSQGDISEESSITCMEEMEIDKGKIQNCTEDEAILSEDLKKAEEFAVNTVPVFIFNNRYKKGGSLSVDILEEIYCEINKC